MAPNGSERQSAAFHRRGKSLVDNMQPLSGLDFGHLTIEDDEKTRHTKIPTKFPPPPYLPGEVERREELR